MGTMSTQKFPHKSNIHLMSLERKKHNISHSLHHNKFGLVFDILTGNLNKKTILNIIMQALYVENFVY